MSDLVKANTEVQPYFFPASRAQGDNFLAVVSLRRLEGMMLTELENPGSIPEKAFKKELEVLVPYVATEIQEEQKQLSDGNIQTQPQPLLSSVQITKEIFNRALGTVKAIIEEPNIREHHIERQVAIAEARRAGYGRR